MTISIITINYNNAQGLLQTMNSVINQNYNSIEYIVIDGASEDNSIEFIKQNDTKITYWVSEPDKGIYDAMNKGVDLATGEYLLFLNSGDVLTSETIIQTFVANIEGNGNDIIYGDLVVINELGIENVKKYSDELSFDYFTYETLPHPSTLISKKIFNKYGLYDAKLKIVADWKFFILAICKYNCSYKHLNIAVAKFKTDGLSSLPENVQLIADERDSVLKKEFPYFIQLHQELKTFKHLYRDAKNPRRVRLLKRLGII